MINMRLEQFVIMVLKYHIVTFKRCLRVTYETGFGLYDWIYCTSYIHTTRDYKQLERYPYSTHFPVHHYTALRFSVYTRRILATVFSNGYSSSA
jgi:hypothetical protein